MAADITDLAIDLRQYYPPLVVGTPEPKIDFETKGPKKDADGEIVFTVVLNLSKRNQDPKKRRKTTVMDVAVTGALMGLEYGVPVEVVNLTMSTWQVGADFWGVSFKADDIRPLRPGGPVVAPAVGPAVRAKPDGA